MPGPLYLRRFVVGPLDANCYLAADQASLEALIIDPGGDPDAIADAALSEGFTVRAIVDTHAHADHTAANDALRGYFGCPIMIHEFDAPCLTDPEANLSAWAGHANPAVSPADRLLKDGGEIAIGQLVFRVVHTPGHTPGGICLMVDGVLFSGDTLFAGGIGRTDLPGGSHDQLIESIRSRLFALPDDTVVYPGHGPETTIGHERETNPWLW
ncbi:MAG TPA: MBL fold metallo-hydrolase [Armatimonadota bacterium]|nr:MBL fold metallo-hydrolase [Armatimonadota bacterium]